MRFRPVLITVSVLVALGLTMAPAGVATPAAKTRAVKKTRMVLRPVAKVSSPTDVVTPPGYRKVEFIVSRLGKIRILRRGHLLRKPFLDLSRKVATKWVEQGLLGLAFPPDYRKTGKFYVDYTGRRGDVRIEEYHRNRKHPMLADPGSRRLVLRIPRVGHSQNHNGGEMVFHHGLLYIAVGDGNGPGDPADQAQNLESLRGKILRIDPRGDETTGRTYLIPPGNPFVGKPGRDEIFAYGFRNPHSFFFSPAEDGQTFMSVSDVGEERYEELNYLPLDVARGGNFGWKIFEGVFPYNCPARQCPNGANPPDPLPPLIFPQIVYPHSTAKRFVGCAIIGGPIIRDPALPAVNGRLIYGDFCTGRIRTAAPRTGWITDDRPLGAHLPTGETDSAALNGISEDGWGRVYLYSNHGVVYRLYEVPARKTSGKRKRGRDKSAKTKSK